VKQKHKLQNGIVPLRLTLDTCRSMEVLLLHNNKLSSNIINTSSISNINFNSTNIRFSSNSTSNSNNNMVVTQALTLQQASYRHQAHPNRCNNMYLNTGALALHCPVYKVPAVSYGINPFIIRTRVFHLCNSNHLHSSNNSIKDRLQGHMDRKDLKGIEGISMDL